MRAAAFLLASLALLVSPSHAQPGAAPREFCDYAAPEYDAREVAAVRAYGACLSAAAAARRGNVVAAACNDRVNAASGPSGASERTVECGSGPDHRYCRVAVAVAWCTYESHERARFPDLYPCGELVRRYPDLGPVIQACAPLADVRKQDEADARAGQARCARAQGDGYALVTATCRRPRTVVPPSPGLAPPRP